MSLGRDIRKLVDLVDRKKGVGIETALLSPPTKDRPRLGDLETAGDDSSEWLANMSDDCGVEAIDIGVNRLPRGPVDFSVPAIFEVGKR